MKKIFLISLIVPFLFGCTSRKPSAERPDIIPIPYKSEMTGGYFKINGKTDILMNSTDGNVQIVADGLKERLSKAHRQYHCY